jgi:hypothetical protein
MSLPLAYSSGDQLKFSRPRAGSGENVSPQIFLLRKHVSEEKMCLKRILRRENISEDISLKRKCI